MWYYGITQSATFHLVFLGNVTYACTNIQQVAEEEEEEDNTPHIDNMVCIKFLMWYKGGKYDNKEWDLNICSLGFRDIREWVT